MNLTPETSAAADNGGRLEPQEAAALLRQTTQQARRQFEPSAPWFLAVRAVLVLIAFGAIWLSVRGQHPYDHPGAAALPGVFVFVVVNLAATLLLARKATAGVRGKSRLRPGEVALMSTVWIGVFVVMGVLAGAGVSNAVVYGRYPATVPLMAAGLAWAGIMARRANWRPFGTGVAVAAVGVVGLFAGPAGAWAVDGVGLGAVLLGSAAAIARQQRA